MKLLAAMVISLSLLAPASAQDSQPIIIMRGGSQPSRQGPAENFTGSVRVDPLFQASGPARASGSLVTFEPGARSAWHVHPLGQVLIVTAGTGRVRAQKIMVFKLATLIPFTQNRERRLGGHRAGRPIPRTPAAAGRPPIRLVNVSLV